MAMAATRDQGKSTFIREALEKDPKLRPREITEAWKNAGHPGEISVSLVHKVRTGMGLAASTRARHEKVEDGLAPPAGSGRRSKAGGVSAPPADGVDGTTASLKKARGAQRAHMLEELEGEVDRLIFKIMGVGGLADVEDALRRARRLLVLAQRR